VSCTSFTAWSSALAIAASIASPALAQEPDAQSYAGTWSVRLQGSDRVPRGATLVLTGYEGTWQDHAGSPRGANSACGGNKIPLTVQSSTRTLLAFTVWGDTVAPTCPVLTIVVRPQGAKLLAGSADLGSHADEIVEAASEHARAGGAASAPTSAAAGAAIRPDPQGSAGSVRLTRR
jgi:hypothetical protein